MPRREHITHEHYQKSFPTRLRDLMEEFNESQDDLAKAIIKADGSHPQRQTIGYYASGDRAPDYEMVMLIAQHYGVTVDWLIGMPNAVRSTDPNVKSACEYLNIHEAVAEKIRKITNTSITDIHNQRAVLTYFFLNDYSEKFFSSLMNALMSSTFFNLDDKLFSPVNEYTKSQFELNMTMQDLCEYQIDKAFSRMAEAYTENIINPSDETLIQLGFTNEEIEDRRNNTNGQE